MLPCFAHLPHSVYKPVSSGTSKRFTSPINIEFGGKNDRCSGHNYYNDTQRYQQLQEQQRQQQQYEGRGWQQPGH